jgi:hypothetical protein
MKIAGTFDTKTFMVRSRITLCIVLLLSSGCLRRKVSGVSGYRVDGQSGIPVLVPNPAQDVHGEHFQAVTITLNGRLLNTRTPLPDGCAINGKVFSLRPSVESDKRNWTVKSPSTVGWNALNGEVDFRGEWNGFLEQLAHIYDRGCFPRGLSAQLIRSAITEKIPLPAEEVPIFQFSDRGERFVNLAPDMEIRIQRLLSSGEVVDSEPKEPIRVSTVTYEVVTDRSIGVRLKRIRSQGGSPTAAIDLQDKQLSALDQRFAKFPLLRILLEGITRDDPAQIESKSDALLIGAANNLGLNEFTDLVRERQPVTCLEHAGTACVELPTGSLSLLSVIWLNNHKTTCSFGAPLSSLLYPLRPDERDRALDSIHIMRRLTDGNYVSVQVTKNLEGAKQLLLLPGDRIVWQD